MGISGINGSGASQSAAQMRAMREKMAAQMQKDMDVDGNGSVSKDEFAQVDKKMRAGGPASASQTAPSADEIFSRADLDGNQSLSTEELTKLADSVKPPSGGPPPGRAPGGAQKPEGASSPSESSQAKDPADSNEDGKVSTSERMAYDLKKLTEAWKAATAAGDE